MKNNGIWVKEMRIFSFLNLFLILLYYFLKTLHIQIIMCIEVVLKDYLPVVTFWGCWKFFFLWCFLPFGFLASYKTLQGIL